MALQTLRSMASGGIYDQVGGGFARYSVDAHLDRPALREDALRQRAARPRLPARLPGAAATRCCGAPPRRRSTGRCARCAAPRAASTARWTPTPRASRASSTSGRSTSCAPSLGRRRRRGDRLVRRHRARQLRGREHPRVARARARRRAARADPRARCSTRAPQRVRPGLDDKRLAAWNALMIAALADAGAVLGREDYLDAARAAAAFVLERDAHAGRAACCAPSTPARRSSPPTSRTTPSCSRRCSCSTRRPSSERWFAEARALADTIVARFADPERGGFFSTADDHEPLIARRKDLEDSPIPSGARRAPRSACCASPRSPASARYEEQAAGQLALLHEVAVRHPSAFGHLLQALDLYLAPRREVALAADPAGVAALAAVVREARRPHLVLAGGPGDGPTAAPGAAHARRRPRRGLRVRALRLPPPVTDPTSCGPCSAVEFQRSWRH